MVVTGPSGGCLSAIPRRRLPALFLLLAGASHGLAMAAGATPLPLAGPMPPEVEEARAAGLFSLHPPDSSGSRAIGSLRPHAGARLTEGDWHVPVLLVSFTDQGPAFAPVRFQTLLFDTLGANPFGSFSEYYREVSRAKLRITGDVFGWYALPNPRNFYAYDSYGLRRVGFPNNDAGLAYHALAAADPDVDFTRYDRDGDGEVDALLLVHVGQGAEAASGDRSNLWSVTSSLAANWTTVVPYVTKDLRPGSTAQFMRVNNFCVLAERSPVRPDSLTDIGVYCHEFGHILGWPDLYDASVLGGGTKLGPGNWCLMSSGSYGGDSRSPELPARPCAWTLMDAGWIQVENLTESGPRTFPPVDAADGRAYRMWWQGEASPEYFLLEDRVRRGYDARQPGEGLLVYRVEEDVIASRRATNRVNSGSILGLRLEEADGRYDLLYSATRGDDGDPFPGATHNTRLADDTWPWTRTYEGRYTNLMLAQIEQRGEAVAAWVQLHPSGWAEPERHTVGARLRAEDIRPLARTGSNLHLLGVNESDSARVYALRRAYDVSWGPLEKVSTYPNATDPSWTDPLAGPLTAVWSDRRYGNPEILYRQWAAPRGEERRATFSPGFANHPCAAWLPGGVLATLWTDTRLGKNQIFFKRFLPGQEAAAPESLVTDSYLTAEVFDFALARTLNGELFLVYAGRGVEGDEVYYQRFQPASGWSLPARLSQYDGYPSGSPDVLVLPSGYVRFAWRDNSPTRAAIQSALFDPFTGKFLPEPSTLFTSQFSLPVLRLGRGSEFNTSVVVARATEPPLDRVLVGFQHPNEIWDYGLGWISQGTDAGGSSVALDTDETGTQTVLWTALTPAATDLWTCRRVPQTVTPVAVGPPPPAPALGPALAASPNPARGRVHFTWDRVPPGATLSLYSPAGRRVARLPAGPSGGSWAGLDAAGTRLPSGVYLYRLEDPAGHPLTATRKLVWLR